MAEREQSSRTTLSFSIDNILRDDFPHSLRANRPFSFALASQTSQVHRESLSCQECSSSARYIRPVYFYTAPNIAGRTEVGTRVVRSHLNIQPQCTNSKKSEQEKSLTNSTQTTVEAERSKTTESPCKHDTNLKTKRNPKEQPKDKKKRFRSHFSQLQLQYLEGIFSRQHYLSRDERTLLASALDMTELQVRNWFQNKRYQKRHREIQALEKVGKQVPVKIIVSGRGPVIPAFRIGPQENPY